MLEILLIEDDEVDVISLRRMFKKNHIVNPIAVTESGEEALTWLREQNCRSAISPRNLLVLLDFYLPRMSAEEFLYHLKFDPVLEKVPVLLLMRFDEEISPKISEYSNIVGYFEKPIIFSELDRMIDLNRQELAAIDGL